MFWSVRPSFARFARQLPAAPQSWHPLGIPRLNWVSPYCVLHSLCPLRLRAVYIRHGLCLFQQCLSFLHAPSSLFIQHSFRRRIAPTRHGVCLLQLRLPFFHAWSCLCPAPVLHRGACIRNGIPTFWSVVAFCVSAPLAFLLLFALSSFSSLAWCHWWGRAPWPVWVFLVGTSLGLGSSTRSQLGGVRLVLSQFPSSWPC